MPKINSLPRYHKRAFAHNYHAPFIYHIILKKSAICDDFGSLEGDATIRPGQKGCAYIKETALGQTIAKAILWLPSMFPILKIYQFMVMPDHVHILLRVNNWSEYHLDFYINQLVGRICHVYSDLSNSHVEPDDIFQVGYCDKPLLFGRSLDGLFRYIRENPHRLVVRRQFPQFFTRARSLKITEKEYDAYGNLFLFRNPDKVAVKISRRFTTEEKSQKRAQWISEASKGTILVSPFIGRDEKSIRAEAESYGAKIILIVHEAFQDRFKPADHDFNLCEQGRLLIISLGLPPNTELSREICLRMNALAKEIVSAF